ncbi:hypothetical protein D3C80_1008680 [compost metagenome]
MKYVLGRNSFSSDAGLCESHIFRNFRTQVMADHQHIQMLIHGIDRIGTGRVCRRGKYIFFTRCCDNIRCVPSTSTLCMEAVNSPALHRCEGVFYKTAFVKCIAMESNLNVFFVSNI